VSRDDAPDRESIIAAIRAATEPHEWSRAMWIGGSEAFGRVDRWSDVDIGIAVDDGRVADGFAAAESALAALAPIDFAWHISPPTDAKPQRLYRLRGADPFLCVDVGVLPVSTPPAARFVERRRHGTPRVLFDRVGFTDDVPSDPAAWRERLRARVAALVHRFELLQTQSVKAAARGEAGEAVAFYQAFTLRPLVEMLRIRHDPWRHDFDVRYLRFDLPPDVARRVGELWFVRDFDDLATKRAGAEAWFRALVRDLDVDSLPLT
jgi:hypothetical protein